MTVEDLVIGEVHLVNRRGVSTVGDLVRGED